VADPEGADAADEALVEAALDGDARALETLLLRHEAKVLRVLRLLGIHAQDREDVAQEVFLRVFRHLGGFRPGRSFGAWIYRVAVNCAHDHRERSRRAHLEERPLPEGAEELPGGGDSPEDAARRAADSRRLEAALDALTDRERSVFVLKEFEGLDTGDVARALGVTGITVRRHLALARRRLREVLGKEKRPDR
jgi:RNA polymerase sigma-70 factor (ECF subfamily)